MKHQLLLFLVVFAAITHLTAQTTISFTFSAELNGSHQPLDSILIENLTQGGDTTLYAPDTVLQLDHGIGINDKVNGRGNQMILFPAYPNPVTNNTIIRLWVPQDGPLTMRLFDLPGRELATFSRSLGTGEHTFTFTPGRETFYLLVAEAANERQVQKIINLSPEDGNCRLSYAGYQPAISVMKKGRAAFPWVPGDSLRFIGFASIGVDTIDDDPVQSANYTFQYILSPFPPGTVHCNPSNPTAIVDVTNPTTGKIWMDRNLGASQVATSSTDSLAYGDLYQWGRFADGHQCRSSSTTTTLSSSDLPGHGFFILAPSSPHDWRSPQNNNLWQDVIGQNNPCPTGYRLPSEAEINAERLSWSSSNSAGAYASPLKLTGAGARDCSNGILIGAGGNGYYWSSRSEKSYLYFHSTLAGMGGGSGANGLSVRCIKDYNPTNPTVVVDVTNPSTGRIWMDRNLGASQVAASSNDVGAYGDLYQWGRLSDGHQLRTSPTTSAQSNTDVPGHIKFILATPTPRDWRSPQNDSLWQGVNGVNNPCPIGYRVPTDAELDAERLSWSNNNTVGSIASPLKLPAGGYRNPSINATGYIGSYGCYWSSTVSGTLSKYLHISSLNATLSTNHRAYGYSVRCIKD